jgi:uncharacterized protein YndB with AHSA1/START domain
MIEREDDDMADIRHRVGIAAARAAVYEKLATTQGLAQWWTQDVRGEPQVGGKLDFYFGMPQPGCVMEVADLAPDSHVEWRCVEGPAEWVGTTVTFDLRSADDETVVLFTHGGWPEPGEFLHHCSTKWGYFLLGLKSGLEGGNATPFPGELKISSWG